MNWSNKRFIFFKNYLFRFYIHVCFQLVAFVREHVAQGHGNGAPVSLGKPFIWPCAT